MADDAGGSVPHPRLVLIDFRYHIVSITAVFLALGIGVAVGATVLDQVSVEALRSQLDDLSSDLDARRADITDLRTEIGRTKDLVEDLSPRVTEGLLSGRRVLFVDAAEGAGWVGTARRAILDAGAEEVGKLSFTPEWAASGSVDALDEIVIDAGLSVPDGTTVEGFARLVGELLLEPSGRVLLASLEEAGYVRADPSTEGIWPPPATNVVLFTAGTDDDPEAARMAALAAGTATATPTMVSASAADDPGAIRALRRERGLPERLATFDSGAIDETGIGSVLSLGAAIEGRGGHFGTASGLSYLPPA